MDILYMGMLYTHHLAQFSTQLVKEISNKQNQFFQNFVNNESYESIISEIERNLLK